MDFIKNDTYKTITHQSYDVAFYDPPFDIWKEIDYKVFAKTYVCFTNFQNRRFVENIFGTPRFELIWHFKDGRWVSHNLPRLTHEHILIYGEINNNAYKGDYNTNTVSQKKGRGCIGKDKDLGNRIYTPRDRKMLNSVIEVPRNVGKNLGVWAKPKKLIIYLIDWLCKEGDMVWDGFAGSGTIGLVCLERGINYQGFEINQKTALRANKRISNYQKLIFI